MLSALPVALLAAAPALAQDTPSTWEAEPRVQRSIDRAEKARDEGKVTKAAKLLDKAMKREPVPGVLLLARAQVALAQSESTAAHALLERCTTDFPDRWNCPARQAQLLADQGQLDRAGPLAEEAWGRGCVLPEVQALVGWQVAQAQGEDKLAGWLENQGTPFAARPCLESRAALHADDPARATVALHACRQASTPLRRAASRRFAESGIPVREADAVRGAPAPDDRIALARALDDLESGRTEAAAHALDQLVVRYPMDPELRLRAAEAARRLGFVDQARHELSAAAGLTPGAVAGETAPAGVLQPVDEEVATALIAGATSILVELLLDEGDTEAARAALTATQARLGTVPALGPAQRRLDRATATP